VVFFDVGIYFRPISGIPRRKYPPYGPSASCATSAANEKNGREKKKKRETKMTERDRAHATRTERKERKKEALRERERRKKWKSTRSKRRQLGTRHPLRSLHRVSRLAREYHVHSQPPCGPRQVLIALTRVEAANLADLRSTAELVDFFFPSEPSVKIPDAPSRRLVSSAMEGQARQSFVSHKPPFTSLLNEEPDVSIVCVTGCVRDNNREPTESRRP